MARILIVEDEANIVKLISVRLGRLGHEIIAAANGLAGLETAREQLPDLILSPKHDALGAIHRPHWRR